MSSRWPRRFIAGALVLVGVSMPMAAPEASAACADDAVAVGRLCVDKYEATVWSKPPGGTDPGVQYGVASDDYPCADNGQDCDQIYAASLAGELPSAYATWFQAQQACANVGKRLLTNAEWQMAVQGTSDAAPDGSGLDCHAVILGGAVATGSRTRCQSIYGVFDMVGNVPEWVADWAPRSTACTSWGAVSDDQMCFAGAGTEDRPGALFRGGPNSFESTGPLAVGAGIPPSSGVDNLGFRCAR